MTTTFTKTTWTVSTRITAAQMNRIETQYDCAYNDFMYNHNHDTRYYTKASSDTTFFSSIFWGNGSGSDADLLDGHHASEAITGGMPTGTIMWWYGTAGTVPTGWYICNGANGTTDYRDHFIIAAGATHTRGTHYGVDSVTPTSGTITIGDHALTEAELPVHTHTKPHDYHAHAVGTTSGASSVRYTYSTNNQNRTSTSAGSGGTHTHSGSTVSWNSEANVPPYLCLYLIKKTS